MDPLTLWRFRQTFSWALKVLLLEDTGWKEEELKYPEKVLKGEKISNRCGTIKDRFARVFQDFFWGALEHNEYYKTYEEVKASVFLESKQESLNILLGNDQE